MDTTNDFEFKQRKYMPVFPKANGKTTAYIEGYPCETQRRQDAEKLAATETQRRQDAEAELEKLRTQLANLQRQ